MVTVLTCTFSCGSKEEDTSNLSIVPITDIVAQDSIFRNLLKLTPGAIPDASQNDSLAFLILPLKASCPACRNKTIDSIVKHRNNLLENHYIILSASAGRKVINSFFLERDKEMPVLESKLFLDTTNQAGKYALYENNPTLYYTRNKKATRKVSAIPATVKDDLREFFSGHRKGSEEN